MNLLIQKYNFLIQNIALNSTRFELDLSRVLKIDHLILNFVVLFVIMTKRSESN